MSRVICTHIVLHIEQTRSQFITGFVCKDEKSGMILLVLSIGMCSNVPMCCRPAKILPRSKELFFFFFFTFFTQSSKFEPGD